MEWTGCQVFCATLARDRSTLGDKVTAWRHDHPDFRILDTVVRQSSDSEFHCVTIIVFYTEGHHAA